MANFAEVRSLFRAFLREGRRFNNYNLREYILRRAREGFREPCAPDQLPAVLASAKQELGVVRRQSVVYSLYGRSIKNVLCDDTFLNFLKFKLRHGELPTAKDAVRPFIHGGPLAHLGLAAQAPPSAKTEQQMQLPDPSHAPSLQIMWSSSSSPTSGGSEAGTAQWDGSYSDSWQQPASPSTGAAAHSAARGALITPMQTPVQEQPAQCMQLGVQLPPWARMLPSPEQHRPTASSQTPWSVEFARQQPQLPLPASPTGSCSTSVYTPRHSAYHDHLFSREPCVPTASHYTAAQLGQRCGQNLSTGRTALSSPANRPGYGYGPSPRQQQGVGSHTAASPWTLPSQQQQQQQQQFLVSNDALRAPQVPYQSHSRAGWQGPQGPQGPGNRQQEPSLVVITSEPSFGDGLRSSPAGGYASLTSRQAPPPCAASSQASPTTPPPAAAAAAASWQHTSTAPQMDPEWDMTPGAEANVTGWLRSSFGGEPFGGGGMMPHDVYDSLTGGSPLEPW